jgi:hypothetical protein
MAILGTERLESSNDPAGIGFLVSRRGAILGAGIVGSGAES